MSKSNVIFTLDTLVNVKNRYTQIRLEDKLNKYKFIKNECWLWTGSSMFDGRGQIRINNKLYLVPRLSLHLFKGFSLESELNTLHKCNIPSCWNPEHLYEGTQLDNIIDRYKNYTKLTYCKYGHEFTPENTSLNISGSKLCKICARIYSRERRLKNAKS